MIIDITNPNSNHNELIKDLVGKPFSFIQALKMKGIVCKNLMIDEVSPNMKDYLYDKNDKNSADLELRRFGIVIKINNGNKFYAWVVPFHQMVIYKTNGISIHAQGRFIRFGFNKGNTKIKACFDKLMDLRLKYKLQHSFTL
jgi:hypothetical protein